MNEQDGMEQKTYRVAMVDTRGETFNRFYNDYERAIFWANVGIHDLHMTVSIYQNGMLVCTPVISDEDWAKTMAGTR